MIYCTGNIKISVPRFYSLIWNHLKLNNSRTDIQQVIQSLDYDFEQFKLPDFVNHLEQQRNRTIHLTGAKLKSDLFGIWIPAPSADYVIFNATLHPIHQIHSVLHELAHIVLNHTCDSIYDVLPPELLAELGTSLTVKGRLRTALPQKDPQEIESEFFVFEIQKQVMTAQRISELQGGRSSIPLFRPLADGMAFED